MGELCKLLPWWALDYLDHMGGNASWLDVPQATIITVTAITLAIDRARPAIHVELDIVVGFLAITQETACG